WNYNRSSLGGPDKWSVEYPDCGGVMQSPISISTEDALYDPKLSYFNLTNYNMTSGVNMTLVNKGGHTAEVLYSGSDVLLSGGNLPDTYKLVQFHFHWGGKDSNGSEHLIDGKYFPMELHLVHYRSHLPNISVAQSHPFGLAVLGFLFQVSNKNNTKFDQLLQHFDRIETVEPNKDNSTEIKTFPLLDLLPGNTDRLDFYRYDGSLTTPPCYESVIWSLATEYIQISEYQLNIFRNLYNEEHQHLVDDFRPVQELHKRTVTTTKSKPTQAPLTTGNSNNSATWIQGYLVNVCICLMTVLYKFV
ncbi:carbonic anhydrase 2, partial [Biomphalaria glabrata]